MTAINAHETFDFALVEGMDIGVNDEAIQDSTSFAHTGNEKSTPQDRDQDGRGTYKYHNNARYCHHNEKMHHSELVL